MIDRDGANRSVTTETRDTHDPARRRGPGRRRVRVVMSTRTSPATSITAWTPATNSDMTPPFPPRHLRPSAEGVVRGPINPGQGAQLEWADLREVE